MRVSLDKVGHPTQGSFLRHGSVRATCDCSISNPTSDIGFCEPTIVSVSNYDNASATSSNAYPKHPQQNPKQLFLPLPALSSLFHRSTSSPLSLDFQDNVDLALLMGLNPLLSRITAHGSTAKISKRGCENDTRDFDRSHASSNVRLATSEHGAELVGVLEISYGG